MSITPPLWTKEPCPCCGAMRPAINGEWLRASRKRMGLSLREMGKKAELSAMFLCDVEKGRRRALPRIYDAYGVNAAIRAEERS